MDSIMIKKALKKYNNFGGVYPKDLFEKNDAKNCYVINTDISTGPGIHWVALYVTPTIVYFFDSFGGNPLNDPYLTKIISLFNKKYIKFSLNQIQNVKSNACGYHCLLFIYIMTKFNNFKFFLSKYKLCDPDYNDSYTCKVVSKVYNIKNICNA